MNTTNLARQVPPVGSAAWFDHGKRVFRRLSEASTAEELAAARGEADAMLAAERRDWQTRGKRELARALSVVPRPPAPTKQTSVSTRTPAIPRVTAREHAPRVRCDSSTSTTSGGADPPPSRRRLQDRTWIARSMRAGRCSMCAEPLQVGEPVLVLGHVEPPLLHATTHESPAGCLAALMKQHLSRRAA
jgi:hypothetical protein